MPKGGVRPGSGRKKTLQSEVIQQLRDRITDKDFETALKTIRFTMKQRKNLKAAASVSQWLIEQKIGRPTTRIEGTGEGGSFDFNVVIGLNGENGQH